MRAGLLATALLVLVPVSGCTFPDYTGFQDNPEETDAAGNDTSTADTGVPPDVRDSSHEETGAEASVDAEAGPPRCKVDADCSASPAGRRCDPKTQACVECLPSNDTCGPGLYCNAANKCVVGCSSNAGCMGVPDTAAVDAGSQDAGPEAGSAGSGDAGSDADGAGAVGAESGASADAGNDVARDQSADAGPVTCDLMAHVCAGCRADRDCPAGTVCDSAQAKCLPGCSATRACPAGFTCCGDNCANLLNDDDHCSACDKPCAPAGGVGACVGGACTLASCETGYSDCDQDPTNGCEAHLADDPTNCGACDKICTPLANAKTGCSGGVCALGACKAGYSDCDGQPGNGCEENLLTSVGKCGSCSNRCDLLNANNGCESGVCSIGSCLAGYANCDGVTANGCEVNTQSDVANCGACAAPCQFANAAAKCQSGFCQIDGCTPTHADCNGTASDGCEVDENHDAQNCGACGRVCSLPHATAPSCSNGSCAVVTCVSGFGDCNGVAADGCETNLNTAATDCGACGGACSSNHGSASCALGACSIACAAGYANCDGNAANGCEVDTTSNVANCGSCGKVCPASGGTPNCVDSVCGFSTCPSPNADCDGNAANGCEVNTTNNVANCGGCGKACFVANGTASCTSGQCGLASCNAGFADCNGFYQDGCEANLHTQSNCGACGQNCVLPNSVSTCQTGTCAISSCSGLFDNCDGVASNGCETSLTTTAHCGACGTSCTNANGTTSCPSGTCVPVCSAGYADCDGNVQNGCETTLVALPPAVNVDSTQYAANFLTSPTWNCNAAGTTTIDSAAGMITGSCAPGMDDVTNSVAQSVAGGPSVMVVRLKGLTVSNNHVIKLVGDKPIVFLVAGNVVVDSGGKIDAGAVGTTAGPGGSIANQCSGQTGGDGRLATSGADDSGGAGGGAFGTAGGVGGLGNNASNGTAGAAGAVSTNTTLQPLQGGCSGGKGGGSSNATGGAGGGAFEISASGTITIGTGTNAGYLTANGGGGKAQPHNSNCIGDGGDGGGSGGGILLVSPALATFGTNGAARVHGGGGGGGTECGSSNAGQDGHQTDNTQASGGAGELGGENGGAGGVCAGNNCSTSAAGSNGANSPNGGGGAGGGGGRVRVITSAVPFSGCK